MWVVWVPASLALLGWLVYSWSVTLKTKYEHTALSASLLLILASLSSVMAWRLSETLGPGLGNSAKLLISLVVASFLFTAFSFIAINLWRAYLTSDYDEKIRVLQEREESLARKIENLRWRSARYAAEVKEGPRDPQEDRIRDLKRIVESWEKAGGAARVRSLKILEWQEELEGMTDNEISCKVEELSSAQKSENELQITRQYEVRIALCQIKLLERESPPKKTKEVEDLPEDDVSMRERLRQIRDDLEDVSEERQMFLRDKIKLAGRVRR